jgi:hypothetical protein
MRSPKRQRGTRSGAPGSATSSAKRPTDVRGTKPSASRELPAELGFLVDVSLLALLDESPTVANHAAYNVVGYAAYARSATDVSRVAGALRRIATDPRLGVRGAAAYAGTKLPLMNVAEEIRAVAREIDTVMAEDTYAVIQRQRVFGELDAKWPPA